MASHRRRRSALLATVAGGFVLLALAGGARADGGTGGSPQGGAGGIDSLTGTGGAGGNGTSGQGAGGGGGAGAIGGAGGAGAGGGSAIGGTGGASPGATGGNGSFGTGYGAGAGGGGAHGYVGAATPTDTLWGGNGGYGGSDGGSNGGGGGAGGYGAVLTGTAYTLNSIFVGGAGGGGGYGSWSETGYGGNSGSGGVGLAFSATSGVAATISGVIQGGTGGQAGAGSPTGSGGTPGIDALGGVGVTGQNLALVLTSTAQIIGGTTWNGSTQSAAIAFTGGANVLELQPGASVSGNVQGAGVNDTLRLGGAAGTASSFNATSLAPSGQFAGFGTLEKVGEATWSLSGSSAGTTYLVVTDGELQFNSGLGWVAPVAIGSDGTLSLSGGSTLSGALTLAGTLSTGGSNSLTGPVTLSGGLIDTQSGSDLLVSGPLSGGGTLTKSGAGTLTLTGGSTATGLIGVAEGLLSLGAGSAVSGPVEVDAGATLGLAGGNTLGGTLALSGALTVGGTSGNTVANLALPATGTVSVQSGAALTVTGPVTGAGGMVTNGAGTLLLGGGSTAAGLIEIAGGTLGVGAGARVSGPVQVDAGGTLALQTSSSIAGPLALSGSVTAQGGASLGAVELTGAATAQSQGGGLTFAGPLTGSGSLTKSGTGDLVLAGGSSATGLITAASGALVVGNSASVSGPLSVQPGASLVLSSGASAGGTLSLGGTLSAVGDSTVSGALALTGPATVTVAQGATLSATGSLSGAQTLTKTGTGTLSLANASNSAGAVSVAQGALVLATNAGLSAPVSVASGAVLGLSGNATVSGPVTLAGTLVSQGNAAAPNRLDNGLVLAGSGIIDTRTGSALVIGGGVSGSAGLVKAGEGTLTLTAPSSYTGQTQIGAGTLALTGAGSIASSSGVTLLGGSATLDISGTTQGASVTALNGTGTVSLGAQTLTLTNASGAYAGGITGTGGVTLAGGSQVLGGTLTYAGPTTLTGGTLTLDGTLARSTVNAQAGSTLTGSGTMAGLSVASGGTVSPGPGIATLTVTGNATLAPGATYVANITANGAQDLIAVGGTANISGSTLQIVAAPGIYLPGDDYALLAAKGGVEGTFGTVTTNFTSAFLDTSVAYGANGLSLDVSRNSRSFADVAVTVNQQQVAVAVEALGLTSEIHNAVLQLSAARAQAAFDLLSGEVYGSAGTVLQQQSVYLREAVGARLRQADPAPAAAPLGYAAGGPMTATLGAGLTPTLWAQGYGGWGDSQSNGNAASVTNSVGGFLIGADVALGASSRAGLFAGFSQSQFDVAPRASTGSMDNYDVGLYAGTRFGAFALRGGAAYSWHDVATERSISFDYFGGSVSAGYTTGTTQLFGEAALDFALGAFAFEPYAGIAYVNVGSASFQESGSAAALNVDTAAIATTYTNLGLRAATSFAVMGRSLTPSVMVGWQHAFGDTDPQATMRFAGGATPFTVYGVPIAEDALLLEAGLSYGLSAAATLSLAYTGQIAAEATQNAFTAQFFLKF